MSRQLGDEIRHDRIVGIIAGGQIGDRLLGFDLLGDDVGLIFLDRGDRGILHGFGGRLRAGELRGGNSFLDLILEKAITSVNQADDGDDAEQ